MPGARDIGSAPAAHADAPPGSRAPEDVGQATTRPAAGRPALRAVLRADVRGLQRAFRSPGGRETPAFRLLFTLLYEKRGPYLTKVLYCPPLGLFRRRAPRDASPAAFLHDFFLRELWRERTALGRLLLLLAYAAWPVANLATLAWFTALNGRAVARRTGKSRARQALEQLRLAASHDVLPPWYYIFELFDDDKRRRAGEYLHRFETKGGIYRLIKDALRQEPLSPLSDKVLFADWCRERGVRTAPLLFAAEGGRPLPGFDDGAATEARLGESDLFLKPAKGRGGTGAECWRHEPDGRYRDDLGRVFTRQQLRAHALERSRGGACLVQPRLENHPRVAELANGVLSTVRLVTIANERGEPEVTHALLRMALGANATVDNFHAGGIAAKVDLRTGVLGRATDLGLRPDVGWRELHPDTHAKIHGARLPFWPETVALAARAHAAFADRAVIGWDVAILPDGPCVIEGNGAPDLDIVQRCDGEPIGSSRFGELLAFHLRRFAAARERACDARSVETGQE